MASATDPHEADRQFLASARGVTSGATVEAGIR
jgi:hypothetical protein